MDVTDPNIAQAFEDDSITIRQLVDQSFRLAEEKGWWPDRVLFNVPEKLALIHSEISEALEEFRAHDVRPRCKRCNGTGWNPSGEFETCPAGCQAGFFESYERNVGGEMIGVRGVDDQTRPAFKPEGFVIELADAVIRIADLCGALGLDLAEAIRVKHEFNKTREFRHGGKAC